jgi:hypothetical protein
MGLKTLVLAGVALATMTTGFGVSTLAVTASAATQAVVPLEQPQRAVARSQVAGQGGDKGDDVSGFTSESPVCSALGSETIPTGEEDVAKCLVGTQVI